MVHIVWTWLSTVRHAVKVRSYHLNIIRKLMSEQQILKSQLFSMIWMVQRHMRREPPLRSRRSLNHFRDWLQLMLSTQDLHQECQVVQCLESFSWLLLLLPSVGLLTLRTGLKNFAFKKWFLNGCNSLKTHDSVIALEILLVARSKTKTITVVAMMETQLMLFHQWNQQQQLKQRKHPRLYQPQLQLEKLKRELNHQVVSKIKTINLQGKFHS